MAPLIYWSLQLDVQVSFGRPRGPGNVQGPGRGEIERQTLGWPSRVPPRCPRPHGFFVAEAQERLKPSMHGGNAAAEARTDTKRAGLNIILALDHAAVGRERVVVPNDGSQIRLTLDYKNAHSIKCIS